MVNFAAPSSMKYWLCLAAALMLSGTLMAQVHKCVGKDGKVTYGHSPCVGDSSVGSSVNLQGAGQARQASSSPAGSAAPNAYEASIKARIAALLAEKDFVRAEALAMTDEHRKMVADAKKANEAEVQEKAKARAARGPSECTTYAEYEETRSGARAARRTVCK